MNEKLTAEQREDNKIFDEYLKIRLPDGSGTTLGYFRAGWMACKRLAHTEPEDECCLDYDPECGCKICERQKIIEGILVSNKVNDDVYGDEILLGDRFPVVAREIANALNANTEPGDECLCDKEKGHTCSKHFWEEKK